MGGRNTRQGGRAYAAGGLSRMHLARERELLRPGGGIFHLNIQFTRTIYIFDFDPSLDGRKNDRLNDVYISVAVFYDKVENMMIFK